MTEESDADALVSFDCTDFESTTAAVVTTVAEEAGADPVALDPLYDTIDPDSLDRLVDPEGYPFGCPSGRIEFAYHDYWIVVDASGRGYLYGSNERPRVASSSRCTP